MVQQRTLPLRFLIVPILLIILYSFLSFAVFSNPESFYSSMGIPLPKHNFMTLSWGGKNTAIVIGLILATITRQLKPLLIMLMVLLSMQLGDINAGMQTGVAVQLTYTGLILVLIELLLLATTRRPVRKRPAAHKT